MTRCNIVVLISGNGSNLQAMIEAIESGQISARISAVISNRSDAKGLIKAASAGIECHVLDHRQFDSREDYDLALMQCIDRQTPDLLLLAGFMRILSDAFIQHYSDRILNIHPSLLPDFKGLNTHQRVIDAGCHQHGASVHFVNEELDSGTIVLQAVIDVDTSNADELATKVLQLEHIIYPLAVQWYAEGRLQCETGHVTLDNKPLASPVIWQEQTLHFPS